MELKDFVKGTISEISDAVIELNNEYRFKGTAVNPSFTNIAQKEKSITIDDRVYNVTDIEFDLSVTVTNNEGTGAKIGIFANVIGAGISSNSNNNNESNSKIKFTIPVILPFSDELHDIIEYYKFKKGPFEPE